MGRFTGDQVIAHPTLAVYTEESPIINANAIASHLELGLQPPLPPSRSPSLVFGLLSFDTNNTLVFALLQVE